MGAGEMGQSDSGSWQSLSAAPAADCEDCQLHDRRGFLRDAAGAVFGALAAIGLSPGVAAGLPVGGLSMLVWAPGGPRYPLPAADGVQIDRDNQLILVRWQNVIYAFNLSCPHQNTALRWDAADSRFQCPKHHSKYQPDGTFISGRATRNMDRLTVRREADTIVVDVDTMYKSDQDQAGWASAVVRL
jgi:nitrite reductase/ring-hydroxylating ferredoxin subunit